MKVKEFLKESLTLHQGLGNKQGTAESLVGLPGVAAAIQQPVPADG